MKVVIDNEIDIPQEVTSKKIKLEATQEILDKFLVINSIQKLGNNYSIKLNDGTIWKTNESIWNKDILKPDANVLIEPGAFGSKFIALLTSLCRRSPTMMLIFLTFCSSWPSRCAFNRPTQSSNCWRLTSAGACKMPGL